jgi:hypothetical protein
MWLLALLTLLIYNGMDNRGKILIVDNGLVTVPKDVRMTISEIAYLFDIYYQTAKKLIRSIEKSGVAGGDERMSCTVEGMTIYPDFYGLEMIVAVAFRVQSHNAKIFREWVVRKAVDNNTGSPILMVGNWGSISLN